MLREELLVQQIHRPVRTCIGCRTTDSTSELFRVVLKHGQHRGHAQGDQDDVATKQVRRVVVDYFLREPGRGAWLHLNTRCLELAQKKRAFSRAFRTHGEIDLSDVSQFVATGATPEAKI